MANEDMYKAQNPNVKLGRNPLPQFNQQQQAPAPTPESDNPYMDASDDDPYMSVDTIPKTENLLQKAIMQSRKAGMPFGSFTPATGQEAMDLGKVGIRQILPETPGLVGMGANMVDSKRGKIELPAPETDYGKNLEGAANTAQLISAGTELAPLAGKGIGAIVNKFRTTPVKQGIEDLIYQGGQKVKGSVDDLFRQHNAKFGKGMEELQSTMSSDDFADIVAKTADEVGRYDKSNEVLTREMGNLIDEGGKGYSPAEVQSKSKRILQMLGNDERAKSIFYKHFLDKIPEAVPGLKELKASHAPIYKTAKDAKILNKGTMRRTATGKIGPEELKAAKGAQSKLGIDVLGPIEKEGNKLQQIIKNKKIAKALGAAVGVGGGAMSIVNALRKD